MHRRLLLLRHAEASRPGGVADHERPLSQHGMQEASSMGGYLAQEGLVPDMAIISTAARTRATWERIQQAMPDVVATIFEERIYEAHPSIILNVVNSAPSDRHTLLIIGHNPGLHLLALQLAGQGGRSAMGRLSQEFPPAALAVINFEIADWADVADQSGVLERFATPAISR